MEGISSYRTHPMDGFQGSIIIYNFGWYTLYGMQWTFERNKKDYRFETNPNAYGTNSYHAYPLKDCKRYPYMDANDLSKSVNYSIYTKIGVMPIMKQKSPCILERKKLTSTNLLI